MQIFEQLETYEAQDFFLALLSDFWNSRQKPHVTDGASIIDFYQHHIGEMDVFTQFRADQQVEVQFELLTVSNESEELGIGLLLTENIVLASDSLQFGDNILKEIAEIYILGFGSFIFMTVFATDQRIQIRIFLTKVNFGTCGKIS